MRITFLGTGAGEGYPGLWCQCPNCTYARKHGGKNIRTNSSALVDDHLMIDISHGCFDVAAIKGIDLSQTTTLLITHPHEDHMYPKHLLWRKAIEENCDLSLTERISKGGPRLTSIPHLNIYGNDSIDEISNRCGFSSPNYFSMVFKKYMGQTPTAYRKNKGSNKHEAYR